MIEANIINAAHYSDVQDLLFLGSSCIYPKLAEQPMREFLHVDDMAAASIHVMGLDQETYQAKTDPMLSHINAGIDLGQSSSELFDCAKPAHTGLISGREFAFASNVTLPCVPSEGERA